MSHSGKAEEREDVGVAEVVGGEEEEKDCDKRGSVGVK